MQCFAPPFLSVRVEQHRPQTAPFKVGRPTSSSCIPQHPGNDMSVTSVRKTPRAGQKPPRSGIDNSIKNDNRFGETSDGFNTEFENTLQRLAHKMSQLPVPTVDEPRNAKNPISERDEMLEHITYSVTKRINDIPDEPDERWTLEQRALHSLVKDYDDEADDLQWFDDSSFPPLENSFETTAVSASRRSQADPREIEGDIQSSLLNLKRRRKRLSSERGEDAFMERRSLVQEENIVEEPEVLQQRIRETMGNHTLASLRSARVIDFSVQISEPCELTEAAKHHLHEAWRIPFTYRPFYGMQEAFLRLENPPCPRCDRSTPQNQLHREAGICSDCYSRIYLQTSTRSATFTSLGDEPWHKKELKLEEGKVADAAEKIALAMFRNTSDSQLGNIKMTDSVPSNPEADSSLREKEASSTENTTKLGPGSGGDAADRNGTGRPRKRSRGRQGDRWNITASNRSLRTINPIRNLVQNIDVLPNPDKSLIRLSVGDPTIYGNLAVSDEGIAKYVEVIRSGKANGYSMSMGEESAREAVARRYNSERSPLEKDDVILTTGTSGALELAIGALANEGDNILLPCPGFPLFQTLAEGYGIECRYYDTDPNNNWEIKLGDLTTLADDRTRAIVVNNPSNPCGSVYSASHIEDLLAAASALRLPIIADEVYADMVFSDETFTSIGATSVDVPILSVGGMSKQFVVPGWRLGWVIIHDRCKMFELGQVRKGMRQLTTRMLVPNTPAQHVLPMMLKQGMGTLMGELEANAEFTMRCLQDARGLRLIRPQGAMYAMVEIDAKRLGLEDDMDFVKQLLTEESVFVLPGQCFQATNFVRIVFAAPRDVLAEAFSRMTEFCNRRYS